MNSIKPVRSLLVGFGKIAQGNALDPKMAKTMEFATHAQVLKAHPGFDWVAVCDPSEEARMLATERWQIPETAASPVGLQCRNEIEFAVLATPPEQRLEILNQLPALKAVLVEKPIGTTIVDAEKFMAECDRRKITVQVNLLRRADRLTRKLAEGSLQSLVGMPQVVFGLYCRGLMNNGVHIVDLARMFFGEVKYVRCLESVQSFESGPILHDLNKPFVLVFEHDLVLHMNPLRIESYRENGLDIWGDAGRLSYLNSGFSVMHYPVVDSRHVETEKELDFRDGLLMESTLSSAFYEMYQNLADNLSDATLLFSSGRSALQTSYVVDAVINSANSDGGSVVPGGVGEW
jgi:predicted dehydrogenase